MISQIDLSTLIPRPHIIPRTVRLKSYQGKSITTLGLCSLEIHSAEGRIPALFAIVPQGYRSILGLYTSMKLGVVRIPEEDKFMKHELMINATHRALHDKTVKSKLPDDVQGSSRSQCASHHDSPNVAIGIGKGNMMGDSNEKKSSIFSQDIGYDVNNKYSHLFTQDDKGSFQKPYKMTLIDKNIFSLSSISEY